MNILAIFNWMHRHARGEPTVQSQPGNAPPRQLRENENGNDERSRLANMRIHNDKRSCTTQQNLLNVGRKVTSEWKTTRTKIRTAELHWFCPVSPVYEQEPAEYQRMNELMHCRIMSILASQATLPFQGETGLEVLEEADKTWSADQSSRMVDVVEGEHWLNAPWTHNSTWLPPQEAQPVMPSSWASSDVESGSF